MASTGPVCPRLTDFAVLYAGLNVTIKPRCHVKSASPPEKVCVSVVPPSPPEVIGVGAAPDAPPVLEEEA